MAKTKKKELSLEEKIEQALVPVDEQPYEVPENWCWVYSLSLFDIEYGKGLPTKNLTEDGYPVFGANGQIGYYSEYMFEDEKALMSCRGAYSGTMNQSLPKSYVTSNSLIIEDKSKVMMSKFICYLYEALDTSKLVSGSAQPQVTVQAFEKYPVPLPPLEEQKRIVEQIESLFVKLDEVEEKLQDIIDTFKERKEAVLYKAFSGELTQRWRKSNNISMDTWNNVLLKDLIISGPQNGMYKEKSAYGTGTKILRIDCFYDGYLEPWEKLKRVSLSSEEIELYQLNVNDIVINRVNSMPYLGKSALIRELPEECVYESNMMRIKIEETKVYPEYVIRYLNSPLGLQELRKNAKQAVNQASINQQDVKNVMVVLPAFDEQKEIVRFLELFKGEEEQAKEQIEDVIKQIVLMKKSILCKAFRGELGTNNPDEESAVELIKQVILEAE